MKLVSFALSGRESFGLLDGDVIVDMGDPRQSRSSLREALAAGNIRERLASLSDPCRIGLADVTLLPVIVDPSAIYCVGLNYRAHAEEARKSADQSFPVLFFRSPRSLVGHNNTLRYPTPSEQYDYEGELAVVIGKAGRDIPQQDAMKYVAGYSCFMDGSARDFQKISLDAGKNFDRSGGFGPWLVTADEIIDPTQLTLSTFVNGKLVQQSAIDQLIHSIAELISQFSMIRALEPGDVIATGTPAGVGHVRTPPCYLRAGDEVVVEISQIGRLSHVVVVE